MTRLLRGALVFGLALGTLQAQAKKHHSASTTSGTSQAKPGESWWDRVDRENVQPQKKGPPPSDGAAAIASTASPRKRHGGKIKIIKGRHSKSASVESQSRAHRSTAAEIQSY